DERETGAILIPRLSIDHKCAVLSTGFTAGIAIGQIPAIVRGLSDMIKYLSDVNSCDTQRGSITDSQINFEYKASGRNCDTTSEKKTIDSAIQQCIEHMNSVKATQMCCEFSHGGTWKGHMQVAAQYRYPDPGKCDNAIYTKCD
ncbi:MAG: hypothetical protein L6R42_011446, partial [Xanthoria sp. 1 TBL-2021]